MKADTIETVDGWCVRTMKLEEIKYLYHGTNQYYKKIDLSRCGLFKDFGQGYYLTSVMSQALIWAQKRGKKSKVCWLYRYKVDASKLASCSVLELLEYDRAWLDYVAENRLSGSRDGYDIVYDRMADSRFDELKDAIERYYYSVRDDEAAKKALDIVAKSWGEEEEQKKEQKKQKKQNRDQFCFKTPRAVALLRRVDAIRYTKNASGEWSLKRMGKKKKRGSK